MSTRLAVTAIRKRFGATQALDGVDLLVKPAEVHAVLGENGAGKSTLMKILSGALLPDAGEIRLDGERYAPSDPLFARDAGVAMVYQEPLLCGHLSVSENILLGTEPTRLGFVDRRRASERVREALKLVSRGGSVDLSPERRVAKLSPSERQLVAIARALAHAQCKLLILDEPTSSLTSEDVERLFSVIESLKESGISVVYISHFLEEVKRVGDRFTVLRDGRSVGTGRLEETTEEKLVNLMAGREVKQLFPRSVRKPGPVWLKLQDVKGVKRPTSASLELCSGEVLGIAGLVGSGRSELLRAVFGLDPVKSGKLTLKGFVGPYSPTRRWLQGAGFLSEDRKSEGLAEALTLADNLTLSKLSGLGPRGFVLPRRMLAVTESFIHKLRIRASGPSQRAGDLSGGNQQKLALARLLYHDVDILILDEPTRGIDVQSRAEIYRLIDELAAKGKAVLMVSSYLPELLGVCDRVAVMRRGQLGAARPVGELTEHSLLAEAIGA